MPATIGLMTATAAACRVPPPAGVSQYWRSKKWMFFGVSLKDEPIGMR